MCGEKGEPCVAYQWLAEGVHTRSSRRRSTKEHHHWCHRGMGTATDWLSRIGATSGDLLTTNHDHRHFLSLFNFSNTACVDEKSCICCIPSRLSLNSSFVSLSINYCSSRFHLVASVYSILASTSFHTVPYGTSGRVE